ncbi:MAG: hypothetical protein K6E21_05565 [Bacilli bacterium]|nr:hypothetical protein [Bacilli bacterium]
MSNRKKLKGFFILFTFCCINLAGCNESEIFDYLKVNEDGLFDWNDVKGAKYYRFSITGEKDYVWVDESQISLVDYFKNGNEIKNVKIEAYKDKTKNGEILIDPINEKIVFAGGKYYKYDEAPKYTVTVKSPFRNRSTKTKIYEDVLSTEFYKYKSDVDLKYNGKVCYKLDGLYYDSKFTKEINKDIILDSDLTIYAKTTEYCTDISLVYSIGDNYYSGHTEFGSKTCYFTETFSLKDIELPSVENASFSHWYGFKEVSKNDLPSISGFDCDEIYQAIYYENVEFVFINKPVHLSFTGSQKAKDYPEYTEYGNYIGKFKGTLSFSSISGYFPENYSKYYISRSNSYSYLTSYNEFIGDSADVFEMNSIEYEYHNGGTYYVWGENN